MKYILYNYIFKFKMNTTSKGLVPSNENICNINNISNNINLSTSSKLLSSNFEKSPLNNSKSTITNLFSTTNKCDNLAFFKILHSEKLTYSTFTNILKSKSTLNKSDKTNNFTNNRVGVLSEIKKLNEITTKLNFQEDNNYLAQKRKLLNVNKKVLNLKPLNCNISVKISNNIPYESIFKSNFNFTEVTECHIKNKQFIVKNELETEDDSISDIDEKLDYILGKNK